jgi:hypothetical protein
MSKFDFKKLREQVQQTGEILRENFKGTDNQLQGIANRSDNPEWHKKLKDNARNKSNDPEWLAKTAEKNKKMITDLVWQENLRKGIDARSSNDEWRKNVTEAAKKRGKDNSIVEKIAEASRKRFEDPVWKEKHNESIKKRNKSEKWKEYLDSKMIPVKTPEGLFDSYKSANAHYSSMGHSKTYATKMVKESSPGFKEITKEEYTRLTGKEL